MCITGLTILGINPHFLIGDDDEDAFPPVCPFYDLQEQSTHWGFMIGTAIKIKIYEHVYNGTIIGFFKEGDGRAMCVRTREEEQKEGYIWVDKYTTDVQAMQTWEPENEYV